MERRAAFDALSRVEDEYEAVRFSLSRTLQALRQDSSTLQAGLAANLSRAELRRAASNVERTYIIRLFAEFEWAIVDYYRFGLRRKNPRPKVFHVMKLLIAVHSIAPRIAAGALMVCDTRNSIVHRRRHEPPLDFHECKSRLGRFLHVLPPRWADA